MKIKKLILAIATLSSIIVHAQKEYELKFDNGEIKNVKFDYDDPNKLPKFNFTYSFFGFTVCDKGMLSFQLKPEYRITDKLMVSAEYTAAYTKKLDENVRYNSPYPELLKKTIIFDATVHYKIFTQLSTRDRKVAVDYGMNSAYIAKLPRVVANSLVAEGGVRFFRTPADVILDNSGDPTSDTTFRALNFKTTCLDAGFSYMKQQSYQVSAEGVSRSYFRYFRLYFHILYGLSNKYSTYAAGYNSSTSTFSTYAASDGFTAPVLKQNLSWRLGFENHFGIKNSSASFIIGIELGKVPYLESKPYNSGTLHSASEIFMIHFGVGIGSKIK